MSVYGYFFVHGYRSVPCTVGYPSGKRPCTAYDPPCTASDPSGKCRVRFLDPSTE